MEETGSTVGGWPRLRLRRTTALGLLGLFLFGNGPAAADVYILRDGDRITGKTELSSAKSYRVLTVYGRLNIPRANIHKIIRDNGKEEVLNPPGKGSDVARPVRLVLVITGKTFWYAWDRPRRGTVDAQLRLQVSL